MYLYSDHSASTPLGKGEGVDKRSLPQPTPHQIKSYYVSGTKILLRRYTEKYRHLLSKYFKNAVLGRQEMMQCKCYFLRQIETGLLENL